VASLRRVGNYEKCCGPVNVLVAVVLLLRRCGLLFSGVIPFLMNEACWPVTDLFINASSGRNGRLVNDLRNGLQTSYIIYIYIYMCVCVCVYG